VIFLGGAEDGDYVGIAESKSACFGEARFTTPLLSQLFCNRSALIVLPLSLFWLLVMVRCAEEKQHSQSQLVHGMAR
jgi:hypothetical protein